MRKLLNEEPIATKKWLEVPDHLQCWSGAASVVSSTHASAQVI